MRQYLVVKAHDRLLESCQAQNGLHDRPCKLLEGLGLPADVAKMLEDVSLIATPATHSRSTIRDDPDRHQQLSEVVVSFRFPNTQAIDHLRAFLQDHLGDAHHAMQAIVPAGSAPLISNIGADPIAHPCMLFPCAPALLFGKRSRVREMMDIKALRGLTGRHVNVVIVDQGLNRAQIAARNPHNWGGGLVPTSAIDPTGKPMGGTIEPGSAPVTSHGMMLARNVLDIAPDATLYDVPLIPSGISRPNVFASSAHKVVKAVIEKIHRLRRQAGKDGAWILVNAWAIFDRAGEYPKGDYTCNTHKIGHGHPLNRLMDVAVNEQIDVVFGAGNCGQFSAETRCGPYDRGEGHSIWGANAHPAVLTVGAVSANAQWRGYSSEGPAPWGDPPRHKPDVCIPSGFCEDNDAGLVNGGSSAATGLAAGVLAAIRSNPEWAPDKLSPGALKDAINKSARGQGGVWNARTGHGVLDAGALLRRLSAVAT